MTPSTTIIGTCVCCLKIRAVKLNTQRLIPNRREGLCEDCQKLTPRQRDKIREEVRYKRQREK